MSYDFELAPLWRRTLGDIAEGENDGPRLTLGSAYLQFRSAVEPLANEIAISMPMFTDHSITHIDALWDTASLVCGADFALNPAEAFVLGGAFLMHDVGMGLAAYQGGIAEVEADPRFQDLVLASKERLRRVESSASSEALDLAAHDESVVELLRLRHSKHAESLITTPFQTSDGEYFYLLQDVTLRQTFGPLIGRIAHSHWWDVSDLIRLEQVQGSCTGHPSAWEIDPLKIACILRLADAVHIDHRRAPTFLHAFRRPVGTSRDHWYFQERLNRPRLDGDRLEYTATHRFGRREASAWWLAWETIQTINDQLRQVDALCADLRRPRFAARAVAGAESPRRLERYIGADGWVPIDARLKVTEATRVIANLGGEDLYGRRPEVALRELIANASDASRARAAHDGESASAVTVRLSHEDGAWWLTVEDNGIGMTPRTMIAALTDFGNTGWDSAEVVNEFPDLRARGFKPIGNFGIGFFAVFMISDEVDVLSLGYGESRRTTHVLEFRNGVAGRPLLRRAEPHERLRECGTTVRVRLRDDPRSMEGLFKTTERGLSHTELLHSRLTQLCALADVDIMVKGPDDADPICLVRGNDWVDIPPGELFRRLYRREEESYLNRVLYDAYEELFVERVSDLKTAEGHIVGRAMLASGFELMHKGLRWWEPPEGVVYVGGLQADEIYYCMGAVSGRALTADRLRAWPIVGIDEFRSWVEEQASRMRESWHSTPFDLQQIGFIARGLGAVAPDLPCAHCASGQLNRDDLMEWLADRDEVLLVADDILEWHDKSGEETVFFTFDGREVRLPIDVLLVDLNPVWILPEEVLPRPRDDRFVHMVQSSSAWNPGAWWYDTGNFGAVGLVVRTIAGVWKIDAAEAVSLMEPLHLEDDRDLRPQLQTADGQGVPAIAIRIRKPSPGRS